MKVVALVSGGKDSCYAMMRCLQHGHQIVALANLLPTDDSVDELDSYMYQTVGHQIIVGYAQCMGIPLFRRRIRGSTKHQNLSYRLTPGDEVEDMYLLLKEVKRQIPSVQAVSSGAIASDYQRLRVESVCSRLGLVSLAYLWKQDQSLLLQQMIDGGIVAITVKVAAMGLDPAKHLGKEISVLYPYLHKLKELYGINVCGEGGEYETLTLDCPLFTNARIVLEDFQTVLHSLGTIAPVGILHPLAFHLEDKVEATLLSDCDKDNDLDLKKRGFVYEVQDEAFEGCKYVGESVTGVIDLARVTENRLHISKTKKDQTFSISCWLQESCEASSGLQDDLKDVLRKIEAGLAEYSLGWKDVLYIHLYIADMNEFGVANETYVKFITQDKCPLGVPSRSTIELPLLQVDVGKAYIEVLVTNNESKRVLHVQSISCWAPSCIGPYSQATLHQNVLYMAGQLGLDPPTMNLCCGGLFAELEQALLNSEAVAKCFGCSISTSCIMFVIYCSAYISSSERDEIQDKVDASLTKIQSSCLGEGSAVKVLDPIFLYVLVPNLPKSALVEVKPMLCIVEAEETTTKGMSSSGTMGDWGFMEKSVVSGKLCAALLCITSEVSTKICSDSQDVNQNNEDHKVPFSEGLIEQLSRFCICHLDKIIAENDFSWEDIMNLRVYFPTRLCLPLETLARNFKNAFTELTDMGRISRTEEPIFNLVPVLGAGRTSASMDDILTCELFASRR